MDDMIPYRPDSLTTLTDVPAPIALEAFQRTLDTGVQIVTSITDAKTERARIEAKRDVDLGTILAQLEMKIKQIEENTKRAMANDRHFHEERMGIIHTINELMLREELPKDIMLRMQMLLQALREVR